MDQNHYNLLKVIEELEDYAFLFLDPEGNVQTWNPGAQKIKGYTADEIIGKNFRIFYTAEDRAHLKPDSLIELARNTGRAQDEGWRVRKDGSTFWGNVTITAAHDDNGNLIGFGKLTRDLTERKYADQLSLLEAKNKELEQFNYIASHDLQEPLRTVSNYIQILQEDYAEVLGEEGNQHLNTIGKATKRMSALVRSLLDISRLGRVRETHVTDIHTLVGYVVSDLQNLIGKTKAVIHIEDLPVIKCYETELRLVFQNLISNAVKFHRPSVQSVVIIGYRRISGMHEFSVTDNGIGIDPKYFGRIFQIFQRLNHEYEFDGHGIGLTHCKRVVEMHGGEIWVESQPGRGSTFTFTISDL